MQITFLIEFIHILFSVAFSLIVTILISTFHSNLCILITSRDWKEAETELSILIHYNCIKLQKEHELNIHKYNTRRLLNWVIEYC